MEVTAVVLYDSALAHYDVEIGRVDGKGAQYIKTQQKKLGRDLHIPISKKGVNIFIQNQKSAKDPA